MSSSPGRHGAPQRPAGPRAHALGRRGSQQGGRDRGRVGRQALLRPGPPGHHAPRARALAAGRGDGGHPARAHAPALRATPLRGPARDRGSRDGERRLGRGAQVRPGQRVARGDDRRDRPGPGARRPSRSGPRGVPRRRAQGDRRLRVGRAGGRRAQGARALRLQPDRPDARLQRRGPGPGRGHDGATEPDRARRRVAGGDGSRRRGVRVLRAQPRCSPLPGRSQRGLRDPAPGLDTRADGRAAGRGRGSRE